MIIELLLLLCTCLGFIQLVRIWKQKKLLANIDGPPGIPLLGNAIELSKRGNQYTLEVLAGWNEKYGQRYKFFVGLQPYIVLYNADDLEKVLSSQVHIEKSKDYELLMPWLGTSLLIAGGNKWHGRRKLLTPAFHFKILDDFLIIMNEQSKILVQVLKTLEGNGTLDVFPFVTRAALDIICETAMGQKINAQLESDSEYVKSIYRISELSQHRQFRPWLHPYFIYKMTAQGKQYVKVLDILHSFTKKIIKQRKADRKKLQDQLSDESDTQTVGQKRKLAFLDLLLDTQDKDPAALPDKEIREETDTFVFEGHDTTAANANWTIFLLGHNQDAQTKVHKELDEIFQGDKTRPITMDDLSRMKYLELCIKESLRIYPSVPIIARALHSPCRLDADTVVPTGTTLMLFPFHAHRDPNIFPEPEKFIPERFLPENCNGRHPFAYIPFSAGPRNCIGQKFAMMEEKVILASFFRAFHVTSMESRDEIVLLAELIMRPKDGIKIQIKSR